MDRLVDDEMKEKAKFLRSLEFTQSWHTKEVTALGLQLKLSEPAKAG